MKLGIDISHWQGDFNLKAAKAEGVEFVIIKGGGGDAGLYVDSRFSDNYKKAQDLGLPVGAYWFSKALTVKEAQAEADYFYTNVLKGRRFELPIYIDVEHKDQLALRKDRLTAVVKAWCNRLQAKGFWVGIYASLWTFASHVNDSELQGYAHWVAQWDKKCEYKGNEGVLGMWQFGGETNALRSTQIAGQTVDQDYMLVDYPSHIKAAGCNGFEKPVAKPAAPAPAPAAPAVKIHVVKPNETLSKIAAMYGTTYQEIVKLNGIKNPNMIYAGQKFKIPTAGATPTPAPVQRTHVVKAGEVLSGIAAKYGTTYQEIAKLNDLADPDKIYAGQTLKIPS
jgi:LysM repeat protein